MLKLISLILIISIIVFLTFYKKEYIFNKLKTNKNLPRPSIKDNRSSQLNEFKLNLNNSYLNNINNKIF